MKLLMLIPLALSILLMSNSPKSESVYDFEVHDIIGNEVSMSRYKGKVLLIVNVASKCGFTNQYKDLQALYEEYQDDDFVVLGFPANNFMNQEPGTNEEINRFCTSKFGVTFPMFSKISVKGKEMHPLYEYLTNKKKNGRAQDPVRWNFQKFLVGRNGKVIRSFRPAERVNDKLIKKAIRKHVKGI
ncbi:MULTISPECIES: glutathione peroxidase [unclassified Aureispira]|uniref:glutathione peroxidase n=1 Tax=unclassified Aureispira TaxID=2649989 RepID=UPI000698BB88|nr:MULTISPECIES: glutathione peroxidase [unclassified Aureispira]WMX16158.1 glutathione peroxidase [Aureispira sp. CCB-E]